MDGVNMEGLIIDDNRQTADALKQMLEILDLPTRVAYGSSPAMSVLGSVVPRFVCLDINMPGVDGSEVLAYIRREPRLMKVPVIVITSDDQPETRQHVLKGCTADVDQGRTSMLWKQPLRRQEFYLEK
jgi:CheY-like chemotaxis protein